MRSLCKRIDLNFEDPKFYVILFLRLLESCFTVTLILIVAAFSSQFQITVSQEMYNLLQNISYARIYCLHLPLPPLWATFLSNKKFTGMEYRKTLITKLLQIFKYTLHSPCWNISVFSHCFQNKVQTSWSAIHVIFLFPLSSFYPVPCKMSFFSGLKWPFPLSFLFLWLLPSPPPFIWVSPVLTLKTLHKFALFQETFLELRLACLFIPFRLAFKLFIALCKTHFLLSSLVYLFILFNRLLFLEFRNDSVFFSFESGL